MRPGPPPPPPGRSPGYGPALTVLPMAPRRAQAPRARADGRPGPTGERRNAHVRGSGAPVPAGVDGGGGQGAAGEARGDRVIAPRRPRRPEAAGAALPW